MIKIKTIDKVDIFTMPKGKNEAMCVTTNGIIKTNGEAVMGRGIAKAVNDKYHVAKILADHLKNHGNIPCDLGIYNGFHVLSFPTKNDWRKNSDPELIRQSAKYLVQLANQLQLSKIYVPKPGCSNGHLDWNKQVKPVIEPILDDRFIIIL